MISIPTMVLSKSPYLKELLSPLVPANLCEFSSSVMLSITLRSIRRRILTQSSFVDRSLGHLPSAYRDVRQLHNHLWQQSLSKRGIYKLIHGNIRLNKDCLLQLIELENMVKRADVDDLTTLARRVSR